MDNQSLPTYWWVSQGTTYEDARKIGFIWAPKENESGRHFFHWDNVAKVKAGDYIFHYANGALMAVSKAKTDGYMAKKAAGGKQWVEDGWRVDADYCVLVAPVPIEDIGSRLAMLHLKGGPVNRSGGANQGYLFRLTQEAAELVIASIGNDPALMACGLSEVQLPDNPGSPIASLDRLCAAFLGDLDAVAMRAEVGSVMRFMAALLSKRFLVLTGLAGSGKTKLAQAFVRWITPNPGLLNSKNHSEGKQRSPHYVLVPVGADWTGNENIVGYPNGLDVTKYVTKPPLELIRHALEPANATIPHFLILDEMNLSHVERYFADLLSAIESGEGIPLHEDSERMVNGEIIPQRLRLPDNLFVIGTVNVDETTYMFSPKVLDRANVIEFRMESDEMAAFLAFPAAPRLEELDGKGLAFAQEFVAAAADKTRNVPSAVATDFECEMLLYFNLLRVHNAEFGYRTGYEAARFVHFYKLLGGYPDDTTAWFEDAMDAVVVQKFLPKLHGSRSRLEGLLWALAWACGAERAGDFTALLHAVSQAQDEDKYGPEVVWTALNDSKPARIARYPLSFDKVMRMWRKLVRDQFVSFAEA
jgi:hypothetical protein